MTVETAETLDPAAESLEGRHPAEIVEVALREYSPEITISFSGAEDVVLIDMASRVGVPYRVFTLDTGRLHGETYKFLDTVRERYDVAIDAYFPQPDPVQALVREKGLFSFYRDGHQECCGIRKVEPLRRALSEVRAYITGQRKDQSPSTRDDIPLRQPDEGFAAPGQELVKFNPLANWRRGRGLALHPGARRAVQSPARPWVPLDRLRALHACHSPGRARARGSLVVGRSDHERVWPALCQSRFGRGRCLRSTTPRRG